MGPARIAPSTGARGHDWAILWAVTFLVSSRDVDRDREIARLHEDCGEAMAEMTRQALQGRNRVLVLEHSGTGLPRQKQEWMQSQIQGFYTALSRGIEVTRESVGSVDSARQLEARGRGGDPRHMRQAGFAPFAEKAPDVDAIVSFIGEPLLGEGGAEQWAHLPPVICFSFAGEDVPALMQAGVLAAAVAPRHNPVPVDKANRKSWFHVMYEIVTPENLSSWTLEE